MIGGLYGFLGGNQQYSVGDINIVGAKNCIGIIWDWAWVSFWKFTTISTNHVVLVPPSPRRLRRRHKLNSAGL